MESQEEIILGSKIIQNLLNNNINLLPATIGAYMHKGKIGRPPWGSPNVFTYHDRQPLLQCLPQGNQGMVTPPQMPLI
eukprot:8853306-Ditylum_brightwellii.AAC.1